ncbi:phenylalanine--tRNA ligase subunit beta [Candidatus Dependentiae bacterium]|nr:phenylalanine--tRNA ligase subunit beta [Candidatus Dependentiae bacterium]
MNVSLLWLLDYIKINIDSINIEQLVYLFNTHTAEIEHFKKIMLPTESLFLATIETIHSDHVQVYCQELNQTIKLPLRTDAIIQKNYFIIKNKDNYAWTTLSDVGSDKAGLLPSIFVTPEKLNGTWKTAIETVDYLLDIDNKSINHRPDLWGHYGIAREIAAILDVKLKPIDQFLAQQPVVSFEKKTTKNNQLPFEITIDDQIGCERFAGLSINNFTAKDSDIFIALRLARVGIKPMDAIVDLTNYVMIDTGHPMHVFDAQSFPNQQVIIRKANQNEQLVLLDDQKIKLTPNDLVIANEKNALSLAGIMGGKESGFSSTSKTIFLEAAHFDPTMIRTTAQHFKLRTEASIRFEKHIDPMQNITALQRFVYLSKQLGITSKIEAPIISVGKKIEPLSVTISHAFIENKIGQHLSIDFIKITLEKLNFKVIIKEKETSPFYHIIIPTNRITKDISIKEDIVEEIVRLYGYDKITYKPILRAALPFDTHEVENVSKVKRHLAFALHMHELRDYLFFDESFLKKLSYHPEHSIKVKNPESENWTQLTTSLVPHLIKNVALNNTQHEHLRFFEWNQIWQKGQTTMIEKSSLSGIIFDKKQIDFYQIKQELQSLWDLLGINVHWSKSNNQVAPWYDSSKAAELFVDKQSIGFAGVASESFLAPLLTGSLFIFELDGNYIKSVTQKKHVFTPWSRYQSSSYDISLLVPLKITAEQLKIKIKAVSSKIISIDLIDFFEKDDWKNQRSLTFRYTISDTTKTLEKEDIDTIKDLIEKALKEYDIQIR